MPNFFKTIQQITLFFAVTILLLASSAAHAAPSGDVTVKAQKSKIAQFNIKPGFGTMCKNALVPTRGSFQIVTNPPGLENQVHLFVRTPYRPATSTSPAIPSTVSDGVFTTNIAGRYTVTAKLFRADGTVYVYPTPAYYKVYGSNIVNEPPTLPNVTIPFRKIVVVSAPPNVQAVATRSEDRTGVTSVTHTFTLNNSTPWSLCGGIPNKEITTTVTKGGKVGLMGKVTAGGKIAEFGGSLEASITVSHGEKVGLAPFTSTPGMRKMVRLYDNKLTVNSSGTASRFKNETFTIYGIAPGPWVALTPPLPFSESSTTWGAQVQAKSYHCGGC